MDSRVMTNTYRQLTLEQRYQIQSDLAAGFSVAETAQRIGCHRSTVYRELQRCPGRAYGARRAQNASTARRMAAYKHSKFDAQLWATVCRQVERKLSPEMIAGRMSLEQVSHRVSSATLYRWLHWDHAQGGSVHQHLQRAFKPYKRSYGLKRWRSRYDGCRSIHDRPTEANDRERLGDWEGDTMYGKQGHLVTLVDRQSRYLLARRIPLRTKVITANAVIDMLRNQPKETLTLDNGVEFADHERIEKKAEATIFFADPYASWQRGSNENANGRLRRFVPRSMDLSQLSSQKLRRIVQKMNHQPRKCLGWKTPHEVYHNVSVAVIV